MAEITSINQRRTFPQGEAVKLVPVLTRITQETVSRAEALALRYEALPSSHPARGELERELNQLILAWAAKVAKLGGEAKGLWLVDFDSESGVLAWRYPESELRELEARPGGG